VPTFCRHGRFLARCPICTRQAPGAGAPARRRDDGRAAASAGVRPGERSRDAPSAAGRRGRPTPAGVVVTRMARAPEDGYSSALVPGLRASADARRLAAEIAFAGARLELMAHDPPGLYAEATLADDEEEALWLLLLVTYLGPGEHGDPFAEIAAARTTWGSGENPDPDDVALGPRHAHEPGHGARSLTAYRAWALAAGSQSAALAGEATWSPQRRFARAFERLAVDGLGRDARFELLTAAGALGLLRAEADSLALGGRTPVVAAARRLFGIADVPLLERRARELSDACGVPPAALDLALWNWGDPARRATFGAADALGDPGPALAALRLPR